MALLVVVSNFKLFNRYTTTIVSGLIQLFANLIASLIKVPLAVYFFLNFVAAFWHLANATRFLKKDVKASSLWSSKYAHNPFNAILFGKVVDEVGADHVKKFWKSLFNILAIGIIFSILLGLLSL